MLRRPALCCERYSIPVNVKVFECQSVSVQNVGVFVRTCARTRAVGAASANQSVNALFELVEFHSLVSVLIEIVDQILRFLLCYYPPHGLHGLENRQGREAGIECAC